MHNVGNGNQQFTIELHHGGFFIGDGALQTYMDERVNWFDGIQTETWSSLWFKDIVQQLGYEMSPRFKFYWLLPLTTVPDGLS